MKWHLLLFGGKAKAWQPGRRAPSTFCCTPSAAPGQGLCSSLVASQGGYGSIWGQDAPSLSPAATGKGLCPLPELGSHWQRYFAGWSLHLTKFCFLLPYKSLLWPGGEMKWQLLLFIYVSKQAEIIARGVPIHLHVPLLVVHPISSHSVTRACNIPHISLQQRGGGGGKKKDANKV